MHGRKRVPIGSPEAEKAKAQAVARKIAGYKALLQDLEAARVGGNAAAMLKSTKTLLEVNPEHYTAWNVRRSAIQAAGEFDFKGEMAFLEHCLHSAPKAYCVWFHREWVAKQTDTDWKRELGLCNRFIEIDSRNFHCHVYRRFVAVQGGVDLTEELVMTKRWIGRNMSNYSAYHYRSALMESLHGGDQALAEEFDLVHQALFTAPMDQSGWLYHRWLLGGPLSPKDAPQRIAMLRSEIELVDSLHEIEPDCKWVLLSKALMERDLVQLVPSDAMTRSILSAFKGLEQIDPDRRGYYQDMAKGCELK